MKEVNGFDRFKLDKFNLHIEWENQPRLFFDAATQLAEARSNLEQYKSQLEIVEAELDRDIRADPAKFNLEKITENVVRNTVILSLRYQKANQRVLRALHQVDICKVDVDTLDHRKKALENEVQLFGMNYYAKPVTPKGMGREELDGIVRKRVNVSGMDGIVKKKSRISKRI